MVIFYLDAVYFCNTGINYSMKIAITDRNTGVKGKNVHEWETNLGM